jgi:RNA polymerase sigma-70 factor (ECF subfamily)
MPRDEPQPDDAALVAQVLAGNRDRFEALVARYQARLINFLYRLVGDGNTAQDLAQEVFVKIYYALDRFDPHYRFSTWFFRVAQNVAIDELRRRRLKLVSLSGHDEKDGDQGDWEFPSDGPGPYQKLRNLERGDAIQEAIESLPWDYRELVVLRHFGELSYQEIADLHDMPLGTVKNKLFRGRQLLKDRLRDFLTD